MISVTTTNGYLTVFDGANALLAVTAGVLSLLAARRGLAFTRFSNLARGLLALFYAVMWVGLTTGDISLETWSLWVRGVSPVTWLVVWNLPPWVELRVARRADRQLKGR